MKGFFTGRRSISNYSKMNFLGRYTDESPVKITVTLKYEIKYNFHPK